MTYLSDKETIVAIKNPAEELKTLLAAKLGDVYDEEKGAIGAPVLVDASIRDEAVADKRNTSLTYSNPSVNPFQGWTVHYNRLHLADTQDQVLDPVAINDGSTSIYAALPKISQALGVTITEDDVEDGPITEESLELVLKAKSTSRYFIGEGTCEMLVVGT